MSRRSARVNFLLFALSAFALLASHRQSSRSSSATSSAGVQSRSRVALGDLAAAVDHGRAQRVPDFVRVCGLTADERQEQARREAIDRFAIARDECPHLRIGAELSRVRGQHRGRVVFRVEAHRQQSRFPLEALVPDERLRFGELAIHGRAERGDRAFRVDERDGHRAIAANRVEVARAAILIDERLVRHRVTRRQILHARLCRPRGRPARRVSPCRAW